MSATWPNASDRELTERAYSTQDEETGLWQPKSLPSVEDRRLTMALAMENAEALGRLTLDQYQQWTELDWKVPHTSAAAARRFGEKVMEEAVDEALKEYEGLEPGKKATYAPKLLDELGDAQFCVNGILSNARQSLMRAVRFRLRDQYVPFKPPRSITIGDIDGLMADGFQPHPMVGTKIEEDDDELWDNDELDPSMNWFLMAGFLSAFARQGIDGTIAGHEVYHPRSQQIDPINSIAADSLLFVAYTAQRWGGGSLSEVIRMNCEKVSRRVTLNQIDKTDAPRS